MLQNQVYERFVEQRPVPVMTRLLLETVLSPQKLDELFGKVAKEQYTRELLFSSIVALMTAVVFRIHPSVNAAYQAEKEKLPVTIQSVYNKLNGVEPITASELVRHTYRQLEPVIHEMGGQTQDWLPGYQVKVLDGNHLAATEHRLLELRDVAAGPLPGLSVAVLDCSTMMVQDVLLCEDGHAQERSLLPEILQLVRKGQVWIGDRGFCTSYFLHGIAKGDAFFIIRQHATNAPWEPAGTRKRIGRAETGTLYEQSIRIWAEDGSKLMARRLTLELDKPTRDNETELHLLTNLPRRAAPARKVAELYRSRWTIETAFQQLTVDLRCEVDTLAYPRAALFGFCVAVAAFNILSTIKAAIRAEHGHEAADSLSSFYLTHEILRTYDGMMIAIAPVDWEPMQQLSSQEVAQEVKRLASRIRLSRFRKSIRGPKKLITPRTRYQSKPHVSTAKLLAKRERAAKQR